MIEICPNDLSQLFGLFDRLDQGESILLRSPVAPLPVVLPPVKSAPRLGVTSSGMNGVPKRVWWEWRELVRGVMVHRQVEHWCWASPFKPWTYAGIQVALQAWRTSGRVVSLSGDWRRDWRLFLSQNVQAVCATATFFDLLLQHEPRGFGQWQPRQVTLGGEPLRPALGARLAARWPEARFTAIYAAAETGVLAKSHRLDGWYPLGSLTQRWPAWRLRDGVLEVCRSGTWICTRDQVEIRGEWLRVIGRSDQVANVAGTKVSLSAIGELAEQFPGVRRAVAVAEPNAVSGQIVCLKVAIESRAESAEVMSRLQQHLRRHLEKPAWPRRWLLADVGADVNAKRNVTS